MKRKATNVARNDVLQYLEETFRASMTSDVSYNGLQFEGSEIITKIATGVDATAEFVRGGQRKRFRLYHGIF